MLSQVLSLSLLVIHGAGAAKTWASMPVHGPDRIADMLPHRSQADVAIGTPPQNTSFMIDTTSYALFALTPDCIFCPTEGMYDPSFSSSAKPDPSLGHLGSDMFGGTGGNETLTLGGLLQDVGSPLIFIENLSSKFAIRFTGGHLGLFVPQRNETRREQSILVRLDEQGQLLNPVWGLRLGGENPRLTIGALDPEEYEGEINWVPTINDTAMVQVDALKGYDGNTIPLDYPVSAWVDTLSKNIYLPDIMPYIMNDSLIGPNQFINVYPPDNETFGVLCNGTQTPVVEFSVEINGVDYPVNQTDLIRPTSMMAATGYCNVGVMKSTTGISLGVTFLRSVYLAYRFPTGDCPGYWGFATPKGGKTPTSTQKPKSTPTDAKTCLSFTTPSSTPTPTIAVNNGIPSSGQKFSVYNRPNDEWVTLRGVDDLPPLKVAGGIYGFGE